MRILFIEMDIESGDVLLAPFVTCEFVNILCPLLDVRASRNMGIVCSMCQINFLIAEGQTVHLLPTSSKDDVYNSASIRLLSLAFQFLIGIYDATSSKCLLDSLGNGLGLVNRLDNVALGNLEIEAFSCAVIVAAFDGDIPTSLRPPSLMLI